MEEVKTKKKEMKRTEGIKKKELRKQRNRRCHSV
jgi:hypothetical protein